MDDSILQQARELVEVECKARDDFLAVTTEQWFTLRRGRMEMAVDIARALIETHASLRRAQEEIRYIATAQRDVNLESDYDFSTRLQGRARAFLTRISTTKGGEC